MDLLINSREVITLVLFLGFSLLFGVLFKILLKVIRNLSKKTKTNLDDQIVDILNKNLWYLILILGAFVSVSLMYGNISILGKTIYDWTLLLLFLGGGVVTIKVIEILLGYYIKHIAPKTETTIDDEILPLAKKLTIYVLYAILILVLLSQLGINISPLLASLGIGSLALGLALQDTLSNFFSGIYIIADKPIRIGDYIKLQGKDVEGYVDIINWRTTRIRALGNKTVIIPNKDLANSIIINYDDPEKKVGHLIKFGVAYGTKIDKVYKVIDKVLSQLIKEGLILNEENAKPWYRIDELGDFSLNFKVGFTVPHYTKRFAAQKRFLELLYEELNKAKIDIPFPTQTIFLRGKLK